MNADGRHFQVFLEMFLLFFKADFNHCPFLLTLLPMAP